MFRWTLLVNVTCIKAPNDLQELPCTSALCCFILTDNFTLSNPLQGSIILFHDVRHEGNTEKIYDINFKIYLYCFVLNGPELFIYLTIIFRVASINIDLRYLIGMFTDFSSLQSNVGFCSFLTALFCRNDWKIIMLE